MTAAPGAPAEALWCELADESADAGPDVLWCELAAEESK